MERRLFLASLGSGAVTALGLGDEATEEAVEGIFGTIFPESETAVIPLGPDDTIVLRLPEGTILSRDAIERLGATAREGFGHDRVVVLEGGIDLTVLSRSPGTIYMVSLDLAEGSFGLRTTAIGFDRFGYPVARSEEEDHGERAMTKLVAERDGEITLVRIFGLVPVPYQAAFLREWILPLSFRVRRDDALLIEWV